MKKKVFRAFSYFALAIIVRILFGVLSFYTLIVAGLSPKLQTIWICSAMRTMSHKYLATMFFTDSYISEVMAENEIDDSGFDSDILVFGKDTDSETKVPEPETSADGGSETKPGDENETDAEGGSSDSEPETDAETETETETETDAESETDGENGGKTDADYIEEGYEMLDDGIFLKEVSGTTWRGYVMLVSDPTRIKLVDTSQQYTCGENVMTMTKNAGAVAGINGGGFQDGPNYDSNGGMPAGLLIEDGNLVYPLTVDNTVYNMIGINKDGALVLRHCTADWALENDIVSAVSFSPFLVVNGEGLIKEGSGGWGIAPRTALGQRETGEFLLLVIDGRQVAWSIGCDLDVLQEVMLDEGAYNAARLDGGSSTAMVFDEKYINKPCLGHERWINNCFVVMPLK